MKTKLEDLKNDLKLMKATKSLAVLTLRICVFFANVAFKIISKGYMNIPQIVITVAILSITMACCVYVYTKTSKEIKETKKEIKLLTNKIHTVQKRKEQYWKDYFAGKITID